MKNSRKSLILLSGGLDSAVTLSIGQKKRNIVLSLTFDYGQKAALNEIRAAKALAKLYKIPSKIIRIDWLKNITKTSLVNQKAKIPKVTPNDLTGGKNFFKTAEKVWVPNRNGLFLNIAAAYAESLNIKSIIVGFNREEGRTFPDNSTKFLKAINQSLKYSTLKELKVESFVKNLSKTEIVKKGLENSLPFHLLYSCYTGQKKMCGECESCVRLIRAFKTLKKEQLIKKNFKYFP